MDGGILAFVLYDKAGDLWIDEEGSDMESEMNHWKKFDLFLPLTKYQEAFLTSNTGVRSTSDGLDSREVVEAAHYEVGQSKLFAHVGSSALMS